MLSIVSIILVIVTFEGVSELLDGLPMLLSWVADIKRVVVKFDEANSLVLILFKLTLLQTFEFNSSTRLNQAFHFEFLSPGSFQVTIACLRVIEQVRFKFKLAISHVLGLIRCQSVFFLTDKLCQC